MNSSTLKLDSSIVQSREFRQNIRMTNGLDPVETARCEPSHLDLY